MTATAEQMTIDTITRTIETPLGFRLRVPIAEVHLGQLREPDGEKASVIWRNAEWWLQRGYGVAIPTQRRRKLRIEFYGRLITKSMVHALARLKAYHDRHPAETWAYRKDFGGPSHGDWARLRFWGLIESRPTEGRKTYRGWWCLTGLGHQWLRGREKIPRQVAVVDGVSVGYIDARDLILVTDIDADFDLDAVRASA